MFSINPLKIKQTIKNFFNHSQRIKRKLELKTEKIERVCEMYSMQTSKKHKIQYRFVVTAIEVEDGTLQFGVGEKTGSSGNLKRSKYPDEPVLKAIDVVCDEVRKNLKIPDLKK